MRVFFPSLFFFLAYCTCFLLCLLTLSSFFALCRRNHLYGPPSHPLSPFHGGVKSVHSYFMEVGRDDEDELVIKDRWTLDSISATSRPYRKVSMGRQADGRRSFTKVYHEEVEGWFSRGVAIKMCFLY